MRTHIKDIKKDLGRELQLRIFVYPKRVIAGKLTQHNADKQIAATRDTIDFMNRAGRLAELAATSGSLEEIRAAAAAIVADFGKLDPEKPDVPEETQVSLFQ